MNRLIACLLTSLGLIYVTPAHASDGFVVGVLSFTNQNGNFCPSSQACTGATYTEAQYGQATGIPEAGVLLIGPSNTLLGVTSTDASGFYQLAWQYGGGTSNVPVTLVVLFTNGANRYSLKAIQSTYSSTAWLGASGGFTLQHGTGLFNPQILSASAGQNAPANAFWAEWKLWQSLKNSNRQLIYNTDVDVLAFDTSGIVPNCDSSCAAAHHRLMASPPAWSGQKMTIVLDGAMTTPYAPQGRAMHELGHIADFISALNQGRALVTSDNFGGSGSYDFDSQEYASLAFAEGLGHFFAATGLYDAAASAPRACSASGIAAPEGRHCWGTQAYKPFSIEQVGGSCVSGDGRKLMNALRFLWDLYDGRTGDDDSIFLNMYHVSDAIATASCPSWPACYGTNQLHDAWTFVASDISTATPNPSQPDANGTQWFRGRYEAAYSVNLSSIANQNCVPNL